MKGSAPFNGPSTTGNPSGRGRGNNAPGWQDDDGLDVEAREEPFEDHAERLANSHNRFIAAQVRRSEEERAALSALGDRMWLATIIREVKGAQPERFYGYEREEKIKRLAVFIQTCRTERGDALAERVADEVCFMRNDDRLLVGSLSRSNDPIMDAARKCLTLVDWVCYYDRQFEEYIAPLHAQWLRCRSLVSPEDAVASADP